MFTIDPVTGDPSQITIEGTIGLGLPLVGGEITPDRYCVDKVTLEIRSRTIADEAVRRPRSASATGRIAASIARRRAGARELARRRRGASPSRGSASELEQAFGAAVDVEWAFGGGPAGPRQVGLLQARPETVWRGGERRTPAPCAAGTVLDRIAASSVRTSQEP